jgi:triosephosphate isomerase
MNQSRRLFIGGNWKSNGTLKLANELVTSLQTCEYNTDRCEVVVAPTFIHLSTVQSLLNNSSIIVSAQNVSSTGDGAFTGEISAQQLVDLGIQWTIIGHSERRHLFNETNEIVGKKVGLAQKAGLKVIACIGETLDQRTANQTQEVCFAQLDAIAKNVTNWDNIVIAYEPVWAIGTGKTATSDQIQPFHAELREWISKNVGEAQSQSIRIIYGGSVTDQNCNELITLPDVDGFLVGGASLKPQFNKIISSSLLKN